MSAQREPLKLTTKNFDMSNNLSNEPHSKTIEGGRIMSYKPEVQVGTDTKWYDNNLAFATYEEAEFSAKDLFNRWTLATAWRVVESEQPVNYKLDLETGELMVIKEELNATPS